MTKETTTAIATTATNGAHVEPIQAKGRNLCFTVVVGHLKGEHSCPFEVHATGCRDLKKLQATGQAYHDFLAEDADHTIDQAIDDLAGTTKRADYWIQPCTLLKRMMAAGRA